MTLAGHLDHLHYNRDLIDSLGHHDDKPVLKKRGLWLAVAALGAGFLAVGTIIAEIMDYLRT
jgi:uncharacterized membrane protein